MKNKIVMGWILFVSLFITSITANAQEGRKVIAVINRADWCHVCKANGERVMMEVMPMFKDMNVQFLMNDLTNDATKADAKMKLKEAKVYAAVKKIKATGLMILVDAKTGKIIEKIAVAESTENLVNAIKHSTMIEKM